jgi:hypothetical protein
MSRSSSDMVCGQVVAQRPDVRQSESLPDRPANVDATPDIGNQMPEHQMPEHPKPKASQRQAKGKPKASL